LAQAPYNHSSVDNPFYHKQFGNYAIIDGIVKEKLKKNGLQKNF